MPLSLLTEERFIAQQPTANNEGNDSFIITAKLDLPGEQAVCYIKFYQPICLKAIINECAGHIIAESLGFSVPKQAGPIVLPGSIIKGAPSWLSKDNAVGWFSQDTTNPSIKHSIGWLEKSGPARQRRYKQRAEAALLKHPSITQKVIALDELIANSDRNPGNLLVNDGGFELIDHGRILGGYKWKTETLASHYKISTPNIVLNLVGEEGDKLPFKKALILAYNHLHSELPGALADLKRELSIVFDDHEIQAINDFLISRSGWLDMPVKMGLLI